VRGFYFCEEMLSMLACWLLPAALWLLDPGGVAQLRREIGTGG
jgi:hypothetical protein